MTGHVETTLPFEASLKAQVLIVCVKCEGLTALAILSIQIKDDAITSEMSVHNYQNTQRHIPKTICFVTSFSVACCPNRLVT